MNDDRNKFTFTMEQGDFSNTMTFRADTWGEALENFQDFLRGCGYVFDGAFDLVQEDVFVVNEPEPLWDESGDYLGWDEDSDMQDGEVTIQDGNYAYTTVSPEEDIVSFVTEGMGQGALSSMVDGQIQNMWSTRGGVHPGVTVMTHEGKVVTGWPFTSDEK